MKVIEDITGFPKLSWPVVTSGTFDGVHLGHQKILQRLNESAYQHNGQSVVITYWPHPRLVLNPPDTSLKLLSTIEERKTLLANQGIEYLLIIPFTKEFSALTSEEFIRKVLVEALGTKKLVIGYDHRFGRNREGSFEHLSRNAPSYGFAIEEIPRQELDEVAVSSTKIRKALEQGQVKTANQYLGHYYSLTGTVVEGKKIGRTIGYPTANLQVASAHKLVPGIGIYAVYASLGVDLYRGMLSIGTNPTVGGTEVTIEVYLFDFNKDIYGRQLTLHFVERLRDEKTFNGLQQLTEKLQEDEKNARMLLSEIDPDKKKLSIIT